jgi:hypothetical protein
MELAFPAGHNRALKRQEPPSWCPACRDGFTVGLLINDLPAIIRFDQRDSSSALFVIDNSCYIAFIAFIRYFTQSCFLTDFNSRSASFGTSLPAMDLTMAFVCSTTLFIAV